MARVEYNTILTVILEDDEAGGLFVSSDDLPGLVLSGKDKGAIATAIAPAIRALFEHRGFENVNVRHITPLDQVFKRESPRNLDVNVQHSSHGIKHEQFVVEAAAVDV